MTDWVGQTQPAYVMATPPPPRPLGGESTQVLPEPTATQEYYLLPSTEEYYPPTYALARCYTVFLH